MSDRYEDNPNPVVDCSGDVLLTQQSAAADCDMNEIMRRAMAGAMPTHVNPGVPRFGSLIGMGDLRDALNLVVKADEMFHQLDPFVRKRFHNSPAELLDFVQDPQNREEALKLGLIDPKPVPKVDETLETLKSIDGSLKANSGAKKSKTKGDDE